MKTLILTQAEIRELLTMKTVVAAVEKAFSAHGEGRARMPAKVYLSLEEHHGDFRAMPAYLDGAAGVKWVNSHPQNPQRHGLPAVMGTYVLSDPATAYPLAIMDATLITAMRTGAAGAVASKYLALEKPRSIGFIGCGVQARVLLEAHRVVYGDLELKMADQDPAAAAALAREAGGAVVSIEDAAACEIVCTSTPSRTPLVRRDWVPAGTHINAMGADAPGKQELDSQLLLAARVVIDDPGQALHSGEVNVPYHEGSFTEAQVWATLGEVVAGRKTGRQADEVTIFDSTGLAIQDLAVAQVVYELALQRGVGTALDLMGTAKG